MVGREGATSRSGIAALTAWPKREAMETASSRLVIGMNAMSDKPVITIIRCKCGEPAEVRWIQPLTAKVPDNEHELCSNCMSRIWSEVQLKYPNSESQQASTFEEIRQ